ncbi:MAG: methyltransferase domain-containing protein [Ignavibacteria bacterium]|nr:methyltransferase domain-containing protein [Ignavibacteria bacterium]
MKNTSPDPVYTSLAPLYAHLMDHVDYEMWSEYVHALLGPFISGSALILELAAGRGQFAKYFKKHYKRLVVSDLALPMLQEAKLGKTSLVTCDMRDLPFPDETFDAVVCLFDSVNYLLNQKELLQYFTGVQKILKPGGFFVFDCCLLNGSLKHEKMGTQKRKFMDYQYSQTSKLNKNTMIHTNTFEIRLPDGSVRKEIHKQKIYPLVTMFERLDQAGLYVMECFRNFTFYSAKPESDRAHFLVRKFG